MSRNRTLLLVVVSAGLALLVLSSVAERLRADDDPAGTSAPAGPQTAQLGWREIYGESGEQLVFEVDRLQVFRDGWTARLALTNDTSVAWEIGDPQATLDRSFGLMLLATDDQAELDERNSNGTLPEPRRARTYVPRLPEILEPRSSWKGEISAPGSLAAGSWVRVVFGTLIAVGRTPDGLDSRLVWITDRTYRLRR